MWQSASLAVQQFGFEQHAAAFQGLGQALGRAQLAAFGERGEQFVDAVAQAFVGHVEVLQAFEQPLQRGLTILLGGQLLAQHQLIEAATERQKIQALTALHLRAEQAAEWQCHGAVERQFTAGQWCIEQVHNQAIERLRALRRQGVAADDLTLDQGAGR